MKYIKILVSAIVAGIFIGIAGSAFLLNPGVLGMFLFCFGLFFIVEMELSLYTGKIGFLIEKKNFAEISLTLLGNAIGTSVLSLIMLATSKGDTLNAAALTKMVGKVNPTMESCISIFLLSIFCGAIMYLAFFAKNKAKNEGKELMSYFGMILCIMTFIACGFEHSIANIVYITLAKSWCLNTFLMVLLMVFGNACGAWAVWGATKFLANK